MLLKMKRTQKTMLGLLRLDVAYRFDMSDRRHKTVADHLLKRGRAEETTAAAVKRAAVDHEARELAALADLAEGRALPSAISEILAIKVAEERERSAKAATDKAAADKAAAEKAAADKAAADKAAAEKAAADKAAADKVAAEKAAADKAAADKAAAK
ncbi:hypothetical protein [Salipiger sp.]|uniref:hypothetical protein n=1 Tax=Salipiger sp. TaxID=2078585 RepID=UPI003A97F058